LVKKIDNLGLDFVCDLFCSFYQLNFKDKEMLILFKNKIFERYTAFSKYNMSFPARIFNIFLRDFDLT